MLEQEMFQKIYAEDEESTYTNSQDSCWKQKGWEHKDYLMAIGYTCYTTLFCGGVGVLAGRNPETSFGPLEGALIGENAGLVIGGGTAVLGYFLDRNTYCDEKNPKSTIKNNNDSSNFS